MYLEVDTERAARAINAQVPHLGRRVGTRFLLHQSVDLCSEEENEAASELRIALLGGNVRMTMEALRAMPPRKREAFDTRLRARFSGNNSIRWGITSAPIPIPMALPLDRV